MAEKGASTGASQRKGLRNGMWSNFWTDFNSEDRWRFPEIAPWQIQKSLGNPVVDHWERVGAEWMWQRRPKPFLGTGAFGYALIVAIRVSLFLIPAIGILLEAVWLLTCFLLVALDVVRNVRWRRDYERSLRRLIPTMQSREPI
jgi:hypothetical protein